MFVRLKSKISKQTSSLRSSSCRTTKAWANYNIVPEDLFNPFKRTGIADVDPQFS